MNDCGKLYKLDYIDALRGIAILMVVMHHTAQQGTVIMPHFLSVLLSLGTRGVQLFFIASAFTLFRSYNTRISGKKNEKRNFFIRRFYRIAPIYYLGILYYTVTFIFKLPFWLGTQPAISLFSFISNIIFLHGISPFWINSLVPGGWSIGVEMMFYLLFPFIFTKIKNINSAMVFLNFSLFFKFLAHEIILYLHFLPEGLVGREFLFYYLPAQLPIFALGFLLYFIIENYANLKTISFLKMFLLFLLLPIQIGSTIDFLYLNHIIFGIGFVGLAVFMSSEKGRFVSIFPLRYIGKISYSLYIIHFIVISWLSHFKYIDFCENYLINYLLRFLTILLISVFISTLTYHLIEIPFQNWAKKMIAKRSLYLLK